MSRHCQRQHALLIPVDTSGHWIPFKPLLRQLVEHGISFTLLGTQNQVQEVQGYKDNGHFKGFDDVELVEAFHLDGYLAGPTHATVMNEMKNQFYGTASIRENLITQISCGKGPTLIISDMFLSWSQDSADELGIPRYAFFPSPCSFALICLHAPAAVENERYHANLDMTMTTLEEPLNLPGLEKYMFKDLPPSIFLALEAYEAHSKSLPRAAGLLINSFEELHVDEGRALRNLLRSLAPDREGASVFFIGPALQLPTFPRVKSKDEPAESKQRPASLQFLDSKPANSILYICFGSMWKATESTIAEIAEGLEISGVAFLWIVRPPDGASPSWNVSQVLPEGFESRTKGRGLVWTKWAPQIEILSHPAVGGFLSHCGWNSTLEALTNGVPVICWPIMAEQSLNARLLTTLGVGYDMKKMFGIDVKGEKIAEAIQCLMATDEGVNMRQKMQQLKIIGTSSVFEGGSSYLAFQDFLQKVNNICSS